MSIRPLPQDVAEKIKSSVLITSLNGVISGLLKNALDAEATRVSVSVDYVKGNCVVEDDGVGILPVEFRPEGGLGKLHHTSKLNCPTECHGYHGDFLASLGTLSLLSITSHHQQHNSHNSLSIHQSNVISRYTPAPPERKFLAFGHGTRVSVRDLFGSMPVRVKQRPTPGDRPTLEKQWSRLIRDVVALVLAWPAPVSISLRETVTGQEVRLRPQDGRDRLAKSKPEQTSQGLISRVSRTLIQARFAEPVDTGSWESVSGSSGTISIRGCISLNPTATRRSQFICLGVQPVPNEGGSNELYGEVNRVFASSSFAKGEDSDVDSDDFTAPTGARRPTKRSIDRWPMFHFRIELGSRGKTGNESVEQLLDERYRLEPIVDLLKEICHTFLKKHNYQPRATLGDSVARRYGTADTTSKVWDKSTPNPLRTASPRPSSPFDCWSRVKIGKPINVGVDEKVSLPSGVSATGPEALKGSDAREGSEGLETVGPSKRKLPLLSSSGKLLQRPFEDVPDLVPKATPATRTGPTPLLSKSAETAAASRGHTTVQGIGADHKAEPKVTCMSRSTGPPSDTARTSSRVSLPSRQPDKPSDWVTSILKSWENPVFEVAEPSIRKVSPRYGSIGGPRNRDCYGHISGGDSGSLEGRFSRDALKDAQVISQVDRKFILARLPMATTERKISMESEKDASSLVIIDQHAADERCRIEELMKSYFIHGSAATETLESPIRYEVSPREGGLFRRFSSHFGHWGVFYTVEGGGGTGTHDAQLHAKIGVASLPPSILERCRQEPRILIDFLRTEIWRLDEQGGSAHARLSATQAGEEPPEIDWVSAFRGCPRGILDLLNSRACRSAVMFNDVLSNLESEDLIKRLAKCAFPFQCAHGRPSMIPLLDLGEFNSSWGRGDEDPGRSNQLWKSWLKKRGT